MSAPRETNRPAPSPEHIGVSPPELSRDAATYYYAGLRERERGPKLIYTDSSNVYEEPTGPEEYVRLMRLIAVPDDHPFGQDGLWERVRGKVVELLDEKKIQVTCVDFVRFTWLNKREYVEVDEDEEEEEDCGDEEYLDYDDIPLVKPVEDGARQYSNPTIWVGVVPNTLTAATAFDVTKDICAFLNGLDATDIDIAYRETVPGSSGGPALFSPVDDILDCRKGFIDPVSVALSLPVAGLETTMQGTMGPYFHVGETLYAITVRHNLFPADASNDEFKHSNSVPTMNVVLMGKPAFDNYLASIQRQITRLNDAAEAIERQIQTLTANVQNGVNIPQSQIDLNARMAEHGRLCAKVDAAKAFFVDMKKHWGEITQRIIGHVVWAPPIGVGDAPHHYNRDLCVVELHKERFLNLAGNVLSLGPEYTTTKLKELLNERNDPPSTFTYPDNGLLTLHNILTTEQIINPDTKSLNRRALKRGFATNTTVGTISRFMSFVRKYSPTGTLESIELPILPHEKEPGTFSKGGDSGSIIVSPKGELISLLAGGTNGGPDGADITYSTPFAWVWELVCKEFPGANLYWDTAFLAT